MGWGLPGAGLGVGWGWAWEELGLGLGFGQGWGRAEDGMDRGKAGLHCAGAGLGGLRVGRARTDSGWVSCWAETRLSWLGLGVARGLPGLATAGQGCSWDGLRVSPSNMPSRPWHHFLLPLSHSSQNSFLSGYPSMTWNRCMSHLRIPAAPPPGPHTQLWLRSSQSPIPGRTPTNCRGSGPLLCLTRTLAGSPVLYK